MSKKSSTDQIDSHVDHEEEGVPLWSPDWRRTDVRPFDMAALRAYAPQGERTDCLKVTTPKYVRSSLGLLADDAGTTPGKAAMFCLSRGLPRLQVLDEIRSIHKARQNVQRGASADVIEQLDWVYHLSARGGHQPLFLRAVTPRDAGQCAETAEWLGLPTSTFAALAIMSGLFDAPIEGDHRRMMFTELKEFYQSLRNRQAFVADIAKRVAAAPPVESFNVSWSDVIGKPEE